MALNHALWSHEPHSRSWPDDYTGPVWIKTLMQLSSFVRIMRLVASTISMASRPTSNGRIKSVSSKWFQVLKMLSLPLWGSCTAFLYGFTKSFSELTYRSKNNKPLFFCWSNDGCRRLLCWVSSFRLTGINAARLFKGEVKLVFQRPQRLVWLITSFTLIATFPTNDVNFDYQGIEGERIMIKAVMKMQRALPT